MALWINTGDIEAGEEIAKSRDAEIERLQSIVASYAMTERSVRNETIEECARVVDGPRIELKNQDRRPHEEPVYQLLTALAFAIRALKDKP